MLLIVMIVLVLCIVCGLHNDAFVCNSLWREPDGTFRAKVRWYIIPEETAAGRQPHNLRRELYRTNDLGDTEVIILFSVCSWLVHNFLFACSLVVLSSLFLWIVQMETILRHCSVMCPKDFRDANDGGDDVFYCEYEYDIHWHNFKRLADIDDEPEVDTDKLKILFLGAWTPLKFIK